MKTLKEKSVKGRVGVLPRESDVKAKPRIPKDMLRDGVGLPELSEVDVVRHYTNLSSLNYGVDTGFYPLGSCTMKYNPKVNEDTARLEGFRDLHPLQPSETCQGALQVMHDLEHMLCEITGMEAFTLQPSAGAHGELTGTMLMKAWFKDKGEERARIIVPDSSHGTNPATAAYLGYEVTVIKSDERGDLDLKDLNEHMTEDVAGLMLTNPNTLGLFDENICEITEIVHEKGGLVYYDGANMNAIMGKARPGDMGYDIVHLNLHKTFSTPHGGGGPGSGPVGVKKDLEPFLPVPRIVKDRGGYGLVNSSSKSIGRVKAFHGSFGVILRAYAYIKALGGRGLKDASEQAVLNANYLMKRLREHYDLPFDRTCMHEFVLSGRRQAHENKVHTLDIAKRLLDYGVHAPTIYFPLIVEEAMMIEPTETEGKVSLDEFADIMERIAAECVETPELVTGAPQKTPVKRLDDALAARKPVLNWNMSRDRP
ncbi:MAG: aminotransferase class V-fold PLP-dependent enzyme [Candidatus Altiarchaeales archaeon]|nr:aminotransferase class V-fold PLP-dependent enzyme [Candidatus Altiarchaeales archaeon]MBD3416012.1 aminotransferase class V-fold PLP-dependent enzyme [Candidatus Altiarchaeales archaeon]